MTRPLLFALAGAVALIAAILNAWWVVAGVVIVMILGICEGSGGRRT